MPSFTFRPSRPERDSCKFPAWATPARTRLPRVDIFLLRSSIASDASPAVPEAHRFLSAEGRQIVRALGNRLRLNEEPSFDRFVTSPFPAAVQTAELFADRVDYVGVIEVLPSLG